MNKLRLMIGAGILASFLAALAVVSGIGTSAEVSASALNLQIEQEKQRLLRGIAEGQILHIESSRHSPLAPATAPGQPWVYPAHTQGDVWMGVDSAGNITTYVVVTKNQAGDVLARQELQDGNLVSTWVATGDELVVEAPTGVTLAGWLTGVWAGPSELTDDDVPKESGTLDSKTTTIFERQITMSLAGETAKTIVRRSEFVVESPLLFKLETYDVDTDGNRTLKRTTRFRSYELLPATTRVWS